MSWPVPGALAFVCPRYGPEVLGGAESVVRQLAERLARRDLAVEVLTTCAVDHYTWENAYPEATTQEEGVTVRRFRIQRGKGIDHDSIGSRIYAGQPTTLEEQERWLNDGFRSAGVYHWLMDQHPRYHTIVLTPYMFWTTYACAQIAPSKNVLRPCLHDEPEARLEIYKPIFRDARGITFNSPPEAELAHRILELPPRTEVVGEGIEIVEGHDAARFRAERGITQPFLLYVGRRELGKNFPLVLDCFERLLDAGRTDLRLVLAGGGDTPLPERFRPWTIDLGFVDERTKHDAMKAALAVVQPSTRESFSRVLMESFVAQTPVLVYAGGAVTSYHARESRGALVFADPVEFEVAVELLTARPDLRAELGRNGRRYVERYSWDAFTDRFVRAVSRWAAEDVAGK